jgi:hypothetical protein
MLSCLPEPQGVYDGPGCQPWQGGQSSTWEATTAGKKRAKPEVFARLGREETLDVGVV